MRREWEWRELFQHAESTLMLLSFSLYLWIPFPSVDQKTSGILMSFNIGNGNSVFSLLNQEVI